MPRGASQVSPNQHRPCTGNTFIFTVDDVEAEFERLRALGVAFRTEPTAYGDATFAVFDDTCGNLIQIYSEGA